MNILKGQGVPEVPHSRRFTIFAGGNLSTFQITSLYPLPLYCNNLLVTTFSITLSTRLFPTFRRSSN